MNDSAQPDKAKVEESDFPPPRVETMRWPFPVIWIVPLVALAIAGWYGWRYYQTRSLEITVSFADAQGVVASQTSVKHLGANLGKVTRIDLSSDHRRALVHVEMDRAYASLVTANSACWIVRPEISSGSIKGLNTFVSGPYIEMTPGTGEPVRELAGLEKPPVQVEDGLQLVLRAENPQHVSPRSPVYYRGVRVGQVQSVHLAPDASGVDVHIVIQPRYKLLARTSSVFWSVSGADIKGGIFSGINVKLDSLQSLIAGGIAMATPADERGSGGAGDPATSDTLFPLNEEAKKEWLSWTPHIVLPPESDGDGESSSRP